MTEFSFDEQIQAARQRVQELAGRTAGLGDAVDPAVLARAVQELSLAIDELQAASEELRERNDVAAISDRRQAEQRLLVQYQVSRILAETNSLAEAAPQIIQSVCQNTGWDLGTLWSFDGGAGVLRAAQVWQADPLQAQEFVAATSGLSIAPGADLPGGVWTAGRSTWFPDLALETNFPRAAAAAQSGLRSGFGFPIRAGGQVNGVVECYSRKARPLDQALLDMLDALGSQVGQFVEHRRAERELRESRDQLDVILGGVTDGITVQNRAGNLIYANQAAASIIGFASPAELLVTSPEEVIGRFEVMDETGRVLTPGQLPGRLALEGKRSEQVLLHFRIRATGEERWSVVDAAPVFDDQGRPRLSINIFRDVTSRRLTEQALRESEERYRSIVETVQEGIWSIDANWRTIYVNSRMAEMLGYTPEEMLGRPVVDFYPPEEWDTLQASLALGRQDLPAHVDYKLRRKDASELWVLVSSSPRRDADGPFAGSMATVADITQRKRAEVERARLAAIVQTSTDAILAESLEGIVTNWNPAAQRLYGYSEAEILGQPIKILFPPDRLPEFETIIARIRRGEPIGPFDTVRVRKDGRLVSASETISPLLDPRGRVIGASTIARDISERKRVEEERAFLLEVADALASSLEYENTLAVVARLAVPRIADWCTVDLVQEDGSTRQIVLAHVDPSKVEWARELQRRYPGNPNAAAGVPNVIRTGRPAYVTEVTDQMLARAAVDQEHLRLLRQLDIRSLMIVPLVARGRTLGAITFISAESGRSYDRYDLDLAEALADRAAYAVDNAKLFHSEQEARRAAEQAADRTARLQSITAALSEALTLSRVHEVVIELGLGALGASAGAVILLEPDGKTLHIIRAVGYPEPVVAAWRRFPLSSNAPLAEAVRTGEPVIVDSVGVQAMKLPDLGEWVTPYHNALAAVPLLVEGRIIGALGLSFTDPEQHRSLDREYMLAVARQAAQALERARLYEAEHNARAAAQATQVQLEFLAQASNLLAASLDYEQALEQVARLAVQSIADQCVIDLFDTAGLLQPVVTAHRDPVQETVLQEIRERYPVGTDESHPIYKVARSGQPIFEPEFSPAIYERFAGDERRLELFRRLELRSSLNVPLNARSRTLGVISLGSASRPFETGDLALAVDLAHRIALAVDNARLYRQAQRLNEELEQRVVKRTGELLVANEELHRLSAHLQSAREEERTRVAREVHDELGQSLTALKMDASMLRRKVTAGALEPAAVAEELESMTQLIDGTIQIVRHIITELRPELLEELGLFAAIEWQIGEFQSRTGVQCQFISNIRQIDLEPARAMAVFRILQESLTNIARHAQAAQVKITLHQDAFFLTLEVRDNGRGLAASTPGVKSFGLLGMRERTLLLGGQIEIQSQPGQGTAVNLRLPLIPQPST